MSPRLIEQRLQEKDRHPFRPQENSSTSNQTANPVSNVSKEPDNTNFQTQRASTTQHKGQTPTSTDQQQTSVLLANTHNSYSASSQAQELSEKSKNSLQGKRDNNFFKLASSKGVSPSIPTSNHSSHLGSEIGSGAALKERKQRRGETSKTASSFSNN